MVKSMRCWALGLLLLLTPACTAEEADPAAPPETQGDGIDFLRTFPAESSGGITKPAREIIRDAATWTSRWKTANAHRTPVPAAPAVDFEKEMVVLLAAGEKPNSGWSVEIVGARAVGEKTLLLTVERPPAEGTISTQVLTHPWHAVVLPRRDGPVEWAAYVPPSATNMPVTEDAPEAPK